MDADKLLRHVGWLLNMAMLASDADKGLGVWYWCKEHNMMWRFCSCGNASAYERMVLGEMLLRVRRLLEEVLA